MPTEVISTVLPDGSKKIDLKSGLNPSEKKIMHLGFIDVGDIV